ETVERWRTELSNWGRWGEDDRLGALNLITPEKRKAAAALVRDGVSVSLAHDMLEIQAPDNPTPLEHTMTATGGPENPGSYAMDSYAVAYHGFAQTHVDALCHVFHDGKMYNGVERATVTAEGCAELDVTAMRDGVVTRGVLVDIAWLRGVDWLEPGTAIYPEELEAWERKTGITVGPGDALLLRTGRWARRAAKGPWGGLEGAAGLHVSCAPWLKARDVAILGSDAGSDVVPSGVEGAAGLFLPIHELAIVALGVPIVDNADLERASEEAQQRGRWEFLFVLAPLRVVGGTGSPANPIALF
ncbi:MAG TPA: cyclase family protein, partial [Thermoanaerobaculia bacterium]|nr:cyclase family protein [Thermoanaerobaculia bacterium]